MENSHKKIWWKFKLSMVIICWVTLKTSIGVYYTTDPKLDKLDLLSHQKRILL